jgi:hypothetical protein
MTGEFETSHVEVTAAAFSESHVLPVQAIF